MFKNKWLCFQESTCFLSYSGGTSIQYTSNAVFSAGLEAQAFWFRSATLWALCLETMLFTIRLRCQLLMPPECSMHILAGNALDIRCWTAAPLTTLIWGAAPWLGRAPHKGHHFPYVSPFSSSTAWKPAAIRSLDKAHNPASMICLIHILNQSIEDLSMLFLFFFSGWYWQMGLITLESRGQAYFFAIKPCCFLGFLPIARLQSEILISLLKSHTVRFSL